MNNIEKIKDKLKKLMAKESSARSIGNEAEADAFAAKIAQLIVDYQIEIDDLKTEQIVSEVTDEFVGTADLTARNESDWVRRVYSAVAITTNCKVVFTKASLYHLFLVGDEHDREICHYMVAQLVVKLRDWARKDYAKNKHLIPDKRNTYIRSFLKGAAAGLKERFKAEKENAQANPDYGSQITGIILAKDTKIDTYIGERFGRLGSSSLRSGSSASGYNSGKEAGSKVSVNKGVNRGAGGSKLLG